jgi:ribosome biogenesis GTPase / thiamine phosphate phosphatase
VLDECFPEFRPYLGTCATPGCEHAGEDGCAIRSSVGSGHITAERYAGYLRLREDWGNE